jgi:hypothetical protein
MGSFLNVAFSEWVLLTVGKRQPTLQSVAEVERNGAFAHLACQHTASTPTPLACHLPRGEA